MKIFLDNFLINRLLTQLFKRQNNVMTLDEHKEAWRIAQGIPKPTNIIESQNLHDRWMEHAYTVKKIGAFTFGSHFSNR